MQWLAHWRAPAWAKRRLGHGVLSCRVPLGGGGWLAYPPSQPGYPFSGYPCRGVSSGHHAPGRGSPLNGGPWAWRGGSESLPPFQRRGGYADCACPRAGWAQCAHPLAQPGPNPSAAVVPQALTGLCAAPCQLGFCNPKLTREAHLKHMVKHITKQARAASALTCAFTGGGEGSRTPDTGIFSPLLYQLSYPAKGLLLQARLLYQTRRKGQRESLQCRENHRVEPR